MWESVLNVKWKVGIILEKNLASVGFWVTKHVEAFSSFYTAPFLSVCVFFLREHTEIAKEKKYFELQDVGMESEKAKR